MQPIQQMLALAGIVQGHDKLADNPDAQAQLHRQLLELYRRNCDAHPDGTTTITGGEYLEIVATRRGAA